MPTGYDCQVYADGVQLADGRPGEDTLAPAVLSGLQVTWGRDTTVDQPEASQCTLTLTDPVGGTRFSDLLRTGSKLGIYSARETEEMVSVWPDPSFEAGILPGVLSYDGPASITTEQHATGEQSLTVHVWDDPDAGFLWSVYVRVAPLPFDTDWSQIPTAQAGERWVVRLSLMVPGVGAELRMMPVEWLPDGTQVNGAETSWIDRGVTTGDWVTYTMVHTVLHDNVWLGFWLYIDYTDATDVYIDDVMVSPAPPSPALVFDGRVTKLATSWDNEIDTPAVVVNAVDFIADLDNADVGDTPWAQVQVWYRWHRIIELSGVPVTYTIDRGLDEQSLSYRDVDRQPAGTLLAEIASSVDGVMWSSTDLEVGAYIHLENPARRVSQWLLAADAAGIVHIVPNAGQSGAMPLSACDVLRDEVSWTQDTQDVITRASVTWLEQTRDDNGALSPTERTETVVDTTLETRHGIRRLSLSSQLAEQPDARAVAERLLTRSKATDWRATGLVVDDYDLDDTEPDAILMNRLLDGTTRGGLALSLTDLPSWSPIGPVVPVYLEGGTYTYDRGYWSLSLNVSNSVGLGSSATWDDLDPTWTWDDFDPAITWDALRGVGIAATPATIPPAAGADSEGA